MNTTLISSLLCLACFLYGSFIYTTGNEKLLYLVWPFMGIGILTVRKYKTVLLARRSKAVRWLIRWILLLVSLIFLFTEYLILSHFHDAPGGEKPLDYVVVLGAHVSERGPSKVLTYRLDCAVDYLLSHPQTKCIVTGGQGKNEPSTEAESMYIYLAGKGVPQDRLIMEQKSSNTLQQIVSCGNLMNLRSDKIGIITSNFHVFRSLRLAQSAGYQNVCALAAPSDIIYLPHYMLREFFGVIKEVLCGNIR